MSDKVQSVRDEHAEFVPYLNEMLALADGVGTIPAPEFRRRAGEVQEFLAHRLMPHAVAEGMIMAPLTVDDEGNRVIGLQMTVCHAEVAKRTDELEVLLRDLGDDAPTPAEQRSLQRVLFGTHALLSAHFAEAEGVMESMLETRLSKEERAAVFEKIDRYAEEVRSLYE